MVVASDSLITLRTWSVHDAENAFKFYGDPKVSKFLGRGLPVADVDQVREILINFMALQNDFGYSPWALTETNSDRILGICGIHNYNKAREPELGFRIAYEHWGKGIATQASFLATAYFFSAFKFETIAALTVVENRATQRVLEKVGFTQKETLAASANERATFRYELKKERELSADVDHMGGGSKGASRY